MTLLGITILSFITAAILKKQFFSKRIHQSTFVQASEEAAGYPMSKITWKNPELSFGEPAIIPGTGTSKVDIHFIGAVEVAVMGEDGAELGRVSTVGGATLELTDTRLGETGVVSLILATPEIVDSIEITRYGSEVSQATILTKMGSHHTITTEEIL